MQEVLSSNEERMKKTTANLKEGFAALEQGALRPRCLTEYALTTTGKNPR